MADENLKKITEGVLGLLQKGEEGVYRAGSRLEDKMVEHADFLEGIAQGIKNVARGASEKARGVHERVQKKGGYVAMGEEIGKEVAREVRKTYGALEKAVEELYQRAEDRLTRDGKLDSCKVNDLLKDSASAAKEYGQKAVDTLSRLVKKDRVALRLDYRNFVPTPEERATRYAGIGTAYEGVLFRVNMEECLTFHDDFVRRKLPGGLKIRPDILQDVKAHAISRVEDLKELYRQQDNKEKLVAVVRYLEST